jgi:hypothetical protein
LKKWEWLKGINIKWITKSMMCGYHKNND